jgi:hypothetical protein
MAEEGARLINRTGQNQNYLWQGIFSPLTGKMASNER